ncbi:MAG: TonB-dependent receptor [Odoribacter sp.]|nr:TonB-dependent receptor [Odoribacter sp.]
MTRKAVLAITLVIACALPALAQKITVTGTVYEPEGEPAIGASIVVQGQATGVTTDIDGIYTIQTEPNATLVFSYIGCETQTIAVDGRTHIDVHFATNSVALSEVVAIGYGTVKKQDATGSVSVIKPDEIEAGIATSTQDLLVGASPGVVVTTDGGNPAGGATIRIRGGSSLNASNDPLIVIDGVPQTNQSNGGGANALTMINPTNIESMTILKDASATAIYGSRASNGVIIITTKKGSSGRPQVDFSANWSVNTARKTLSMMSGEEFADFVRNQYGVESAIAKLGSASTDWQKEVLRTSFSQDYNLSIGGKSGILPYRANISYTNNQGILETSSMQRTTVGLNLSPKFFDNHLSVNANVTGTYIYTGNADTGAIGAATAYDPTQPVYTAYPTVGNTGLTMYNGFTQYINSATGQWDNNALTNPVSLLRDVDSHNSSLSSTGSLQLDYSLHFLPELHVNLNLGYQVSQNKCRSITAANSLSAWNNGDLRTINNATAAATRYKWYELQRNTMLSFFLNYKKEFEVIKSSVDVTAGYDWQRFDYHGKSNTYVYSAGFVPGVDTGFLGYQDGTFHINYGSDAAKGETVGHRPDDRWANPLQLVSWFGRINYIFDDTYLLTVNLRNDGSSRFSKQHRWGLFPSVALGWKINNLAPLRDKTWLNEWKLRLGWGQTGQQDVQSYFPYLPIYTISNTIGFLYPGMHGGWIEPLYPQPYDNSIKWETTTNWNAGMDFAFLNNRITATIEWYLRDTKDLLSVTPAQGMQTSNYLTTNIGDLRNYGIEGTITARPVVTKDFTWTTALNVAWNRNKITRLSGDADSDMVEAGGLDFGTLQWHMPGEAAFTYRLYQQVYDSNGDPIPGQYVDQNADGKIDNNDLINFHSPEPKVTFNWSNNFRYKNWDFGFTLRANIGNWVYNNPRYSRTRLSEVNRYDLRNLMRDEFIFTTSDANLGLSDYWVENASFIRCDNITLGYTFENLLQDKLNLRLFGACQNPFVITKYKGIDPEVAGGIDNNVYPRPVTFTLGLIATF